MDLTPNSTYYKRENKKEKEKNQNIQVFVRCRPLNSQERKHNGYSVVDVNADKREITVRERQTEKAYAKTFTFDKVFPPLAKQVDVYKTVVQPLLDEVLTGYNCTVFAYGQTGTGKTFTMEGEKDPKNGASWEEEPLAGIIPRCLHHLFEELGNQDVEYSVRVSYLELYNEELFDLLSPCDDTSKLRLFEDPARKGSVIIQGLEEVFVQNIDDVYEILNRGSEKRKTASTLMNAHSSRSHSVFSVTIHIKENTVDGEELLKTGKLNLVDLAGSENIGRSGAVDKRAREAGNINQSLLTLGRVIMALVEKAPHVPYRESKLTRLLQDSLGGRTKTSIIATISPASCNLEETLSTLDYAHRAKNIMNRPEVNQKMTKRALMKEYIAENERLRRDLVAARERNGFFIDESNYRAMEAQILQSSKDMIEKVANIENLEAEILRVNELFENTKRELETTSTNLQITEKNLIQTKSSLNCARKQLTEKIQECNEQKYIVSEHVKKEEILSDQANLIIKTADIALSDVNGLYAKLERKRDVESQNDEASQRFQSCQEHKLSQLLNNIKRFTFDSKAFCLDLKENINKKSSKQSSDLNVFSDLMTATISSHFNKLDDNLKSMHTQAEESLQATDVLIDLTRHLKAATLEHHNQQEKKCFFDLDIIGNMLNDQSAIIRKSNTDLLTKLESHESSTRTFSTLIIDAIEKYSQESNSCSDKLLQESELMKTQMSELKRINENRQNAHSMQFEMLRKQMDVYEKHMNSYSEETNVTLEAIDTTQQEHNQGLDLRSSNTEAFTTDLRKTVNNYQSSAIDGIRTNLEISEESAETLNGKCYNMQKKIEDLKSEMNDMGNKSIMDLDRQTAAVETGLHNHSKTIASNLDSLQRQTEALKQGFRVSSNKLEDLLETQQTTIQDQVQEYQDQIARQCAITEDSSVIMIQDLDQMREDANRYFEQDLRQYESTGTTPQRKDFPFPRDLAATSPHNVLVQRYRIQESDIIHAMSLPLPSDDSDKESTSLSPINSLTDLSVISSDLTDRGEEVKENVKLKSRPKAKVKNIESKKLKAKERKPLVSQNSTA